MVAISWLSHQNNGRVASTKWKALRHLLSKKCHLLSLIDYYACVAPPYIWFTLWINDSDLPSSAQFRMAATISCHASCVVCDTIRTESFYQINALALKQNDERLSGSKQKMGGASPLLLSLACLVSFFQTVSFIKAQMMNYCRPQLIVIIPQKTKIKF